MPPPLSISLALQPPSFHSLPTHSKSRLASTRSLSSLSSTISHTISTTPVLSPSRPNTPTAITSSPLTSTTGSVRNSKAVAGSVSITASARLPLAKQQTQSASLSQSSLSHSHASPTPTRSSAAAATELSLVHASREDENGNDNASGTPADDQSVLAFVASSSSSSTPLSPLSKSVSVSALSPPVAALARSQSQPRSHSPPCSSFALSSTSSPLHLPSPVHLHSSTSQSQPASPVDNSLASQPALSGPNANSVLWKAYSRVKQTIADATQTTKPLETMSEYWYSLSSPRPQDLQQQHPHQGNCDNNSSISSLTAESPNMGLCVDINAPGGVTSAPLSASPRTPSNIRSNINNNSIGSRGSHKGCTNDRAPPDATSASTASPEARSNSVKNSPSSYTRVSSSLQSAQTMATEHGRQFAQRSRTSVNRLLDTVLDNATSLAESNAAHEPYPEEEELRKKQSHTAVKQRQAVSRAKFFVCNESEEDESESEDENENTFAVHHHSPRATLYSAPMVSSGETEEHDGDCEDFDVSEQEDNNDAEEEIYFGKKMPIVSNHHRTATTAPSQDQNTGGMERRQSLLSDLLMAEKRKQQQQACSETSAPNSDGEMTIARMAIPMPHIYPLAQQRNSSREPAFSETTPRSSLVRTKKVYKNLAELAKTSPVTRVAPITSATPVAPVITVTPSAPQRENSPLKTCNTAVSTTHSTASLSSASSPTTTCTLSASPILSTTGWTRSQVQVQIQSLVTQSTTTAQRALLTASATLTDVLFRTAQ